MSEKYDEKKDDVVQVQVLSPEEGADVDPVALGDTGKDVLEAEARIDTITLDETREILTRVAVVHKFDQNFSSEMLEQIQAFLDNPDIEANPEKHATTIHAMKLEALLIRDNSPYPEVRAVVDNTDDPSLPSLTFRVWTIGLIFCAIGSFINQLFSIRFPGIGVGTDVAQLLAYPFGKFLERVLPRWKATIFGREVTLNPGPFNRKEHMLITIMINAGVGSPYTGYIIFSQALPMYFNMPYAKKFGYQILNTLASSIAGYGLAGLCRRFIVYPSYCIWPSSLPTLALNKAFHLDDSTSVPGPFKRFYNWTRMKFFLATFAAMFVYFWFPGFIFEALSIFNWPTWIAPKNKMLGIITGTRNGLGINPWPTFDWNYAGGLATPLFSMQNNFLGVIVSLFVVIGIYWNNAWNTAYMPINSNKTYDNMGKSYNVSKIINERGSFDNEKYQKYSEPWMAAGNLTLYFFFFAMYSSTIAYTILYHRREIAEGFRSFWRGLKRSVGRSNDQDQDDVGEDVHYRLMKAYPEVAEWKYFILVLLSIALGVAGLKAYPTYTSPAVVLYGIALSLIFMVPIGIITAITGTEVTLNVLAEFIGGVMVPGEAISLNYFKMYGVVTAMQAIGFSHDLKLAHYTKIKPSHTFYVQIVSTCLGAFVATSLFNFQMGFKGVCTPDAAFKLTCPGVNTFFTASVFWGTVGPKKIFGIGSRYSMLLLGFPVGFVLPFIGWALQKRFPRVSLFRKLHPVVICAGGLAWAPGNMAYVWPGVMANFVSWFIIRRRFLAFWGRYNYILSASWSAAIAIAGIVIFFAVQMPEKSLDWWGNNVPYQGCEGRACTLKTLAEGQYFGAAPGNYN